MGGLLAKTYANYRQRRYRRWKLQVCFTKFGTITKNKLQAPEKHFSQNWELHAIFRLVFVTEFVKAWAIRQPATFLNFCREYLSYAAELPYCIDIAIIPDKQSRKELTEAIVIRSRRINTLYNAKPAMHEPSVTG